MRVRTAIHPILVVIFIASLYLIIRRTRTSEIDTPISINTTTTYTKLYPPILLYEDKIMYNAIAQRIMDDMMISANDPIKLLRLKELMERLNRNWEHVEDPYALKLVNETKAEKEARNKTQQGENQAGKSRKNTLMKTV
jgi:hypothetical protein